MSVHIKTTHVGSLPRPTDLLPYIRGDKPPPDNHEDLLSDATQAVLKRQTDIGIDVINDGELIEKKILEVFCRDALEGCGGAAGCMRLGTGCGLDVLSVIF